MKRAMRESEKRIVLTLRDDDLIVWDEMPKPSESVLLTSILLFVVHFSIPHLSIWVSHWDYVAFSID